MEVFQNDIMISYSSRKKRIAMDIYNELVEKGNYKIWMAPKSIPSGSNYSNEIYKGIQFSKIVLFVMSRKSLKSAFCKDELLQAVSLGITVLPVLIDREKDPYTKLGNIHAEVKRSQIFKAFPWYKELIDNLIKEIQRLMQNSGEPAPISSYRLCDDFIIGREKEATFIFDEIEKSHTKINIFGQGGIGKSYAIRKFISKYVGDTTLRAITMIEYKDSIKATIASLPINNFDDNEYFLGLKNTKISKEDALYEKKMSLLRGFGCNYILFIDGVDYIDEEEIKPLLSLPTAVVIVSRNAYELEGLVNKEIGQMDMNECLKLFYLNAKLKHNKENNEKIIKIIEDAGRHTFSINLLSKQVGENRLTLDDLLDGDLLEYLNSYDKKGNIKNIINKANLDEELLNTLKFISFFKTGLKKGSAQLINRTLIPNLVDLNNKGLVSEDNISFTAHQIVRETMLYQYEIKIEDIEKYIVKFFDVYRKIFKNKQEIFSIMETMLENIKGNNKLMALMYHEFGMTFSDFGYSELFHIPPELYESQDMEFHTITNEKEVNIEDFNKAEKWQRKAIEIYNSLPNKEDRVKLASSTSALGSSYFNRNDFETAFKYQMEALKYAKEYLEPTSHTYKVILDRIVKTGIYTNNKDHFNEIISSIDEMERVAQLPNSIHINLSEVYYQKANLYKQYKDYDKAIELYKKSVETNEDDLSTSYGHSELLMSLAYIYKELGRNDESKTCYKEARNIKKNIINNKDTLKEFIDKFDKIYL